MVESNQEYERHQLQHGLQHPHLQLHQQHPDQQNSQLLTPQSGTTQQHLRPDFPSPLGTKPLYLNYQRTLPPTDVTNEDLDDRYLQFILYCNPSIPDAVDPTELKQGLRSPPRSDGKNYCPWVIYRLIARLESKEIKSWTSLVVEMGVELPDASRNQSTQKVQQYAVRLKRWLHAYHIDAFYHYCLGIPSEYYTTIPPPTAPIGDLARDGVPPEDDLAIRALCPEWRPKRGRRKVDDEAEFRSLQDIRQRQSQRELKAIDSRRASGAEMTASQAVEEQGTPAPTTPWSALPQGRDPWSAAHSAIAPKTSSTDPTSMPPGGQSHMAPAPYQYPPYNNIRWRVNSLGSPLNPAVSGESGAPPTPQSAEPGSQPQAPSSAYPSPSTPNLGKRKRQGSAVSSAWQGGRDANSGKIRGRPPRDRSVVDGQFSTFPANPPTSEQEQAQYDRRTSVSHTTPSVIADLDDDANVGPLEIPQRPQRQSGQGSRDEASASQSSPPQTAPRTQLHISGVTSSGKKPSKLQLQVPTRHGGPVTLAEPPQLLINGEATPEVEISHRDSGVSFPEDDHNNHGEGEEDHHDNDDDDDGTAHHGLSPDDPGGTTTIDDYDDGDAKDKDASAPKISEDARKWKRKALFLEKKVKEKEEELKAVKRRVLEAVM